MTAGEDFCSGGKLSIQESDDQKWARIDMTASGSKSWPYYNKINYALARKASSGLSTVVEYLFYYVVMLFTSSGLSSVA